jgi:hypothetical protein
MSDSTIDWVINGVDTNGMYLDEEGHRKLRNVCHAAAEEVLARLPNWPTLASQAAPTWKCYHCGASSTNACIANGCAACEAAAPAPAVAVDAPTIDWITEKILSYTRPETPRDHEAAQRCARVIATAYAKTRPAQPAGDERVMCEHQNKSPNYTHTDCDDCGAIWTDGEWGIASRMQFPSFAVAKFYKEHGRMPEIATSATSATIAAQQPAQADDAQQAARYRWLRDNMTFSTEKNSVSEMSLARWIPAPEHNPHTDWVGDCFEASVDRTIDAAIAAQKGE